MLESKFNLAITCNHRHLAAGGNEPADLVANDVADRLCQSNVAGIDKAR
jgi:hypothetical protein